MGFSIAFGTWDGARDEFGLPVLEHGDDALTGLSYSLVAALLRNAAFAELWSDMRGGDVDGADPVVSPISVRRLERAARDARAAPRARPTAAAAAIACLLRAARAAHRRAGGRPLFVQC
jgi:hypothetical protein